MSSLALAYLISAIGSIGSLAIILLVKPRS